MRYKITLDYDGAPFCGWQIQPDAPSVQGCLENALTTLLKEKVQVVGAGRTDTGVNAVGYVAHFDAAELPDCGRLASRLNAILPRSIAVTALEPAPSDFHARFDARRRTYRYYIHRRKDPFAERYSYFYGYPSLDFDAMNEAAAHLLGEHDFSCFEKTGGDNRTSNCTVFTARWSPLSGTSCPQRGISNDGATCCGGINGALLPSWLPGTSCPQRGISNDGATCCGGSEGIFLPSRGQDVPESRWCFEISADRFLRNMVRAIVGTLLEVGRGRRSVEEFAALVLPPSENKATGTARRTLAGESVPGNALFLAGIEY